MAYTPTNVINVFAWGKSVGAVAQDSSTGYYAFEYDDSWIRRGIELAPLTMPLGRTVYAFPNLSLETYKRLPAALADALPDKFGNALIDAYLAQQGVNPEAIKPLDRLAYMASRSMGALEFRPAKGPRTKQPTAVALSELVGASRRALAGHFAGDKETEAALLNLIQVGTSAGGARAKAVISWNRDTNEIQSGQYAAKPGFEHWLLKLDGVGEDHELGSSEQYGRIEYAYANMAKQAGIEMAECHLLEENGRAHFMTKRWDREGETKIHVQTLCAMAELDFNQRGAHDYAQYFLVLNQLGMGPDERAQAFRRMVFNVLAANCDDHTKNLSFILPEGGNWALSPAYDVTHAYAPTGQWTYQHLMSVNGKFIGITFKDMIAVAERFEVPKPTAIIREVREALEAWSDFAKAAGISAAIRDSIAVDMRTFAEAANFPGRSQKR